MQKELIEKNEEVKRKTEEISQLTAKVSYTVSKPFGNKMTNENFQNDVTLMSSRFLNVNSGSTNCLD